MIHYIIYTCTSLKSHDNEIVFTATFLVIVLFPYLSSLWRTREIILPLLSFLIANVDIIVVITIFPRGQRGFEIVVLRAFSVLEGTGANNLFL